MVKDKRLVLALVLAGVLVLGVLGWALFIREQEEVRVVDSFETCVAAGNPVLESYPERCLADGKSYTNPNQTLTPPAEN